MASRLTDCTYTGVYEHHVVSTFQRAQCVNRSLCYITFCDVTLLMRAMRVIWGAVVAGVRHCEARCLTKDNHFR